MLSGATVQRRGDGRAPPVFRIVVSSDSMKNATATSHGSSALLAALMEVPSNATPAAALPAPADVAA